MVVPTAAWHAQGCIQRRGCEEEAKQLLSTPREIYIAGGDANPKHRNGPKIKPVQVRSVNCLQLEENQQFGVDPDPSVAKPLGPLSGRGTLALDHSYHC
jgi:hypothetical protein